MSRMLGPAFAAMLTLAALVGVSAEAEAGFWHRRHAVVTPVVMTPVGVVGAAQLGSGFGDARYGTYYPYYYHAPVYGYYSGPTHYYSKPAFFYGAPVHRARRVAHRAKPHCNCNHRLH